MGEVSTIGLDIAKSVFQIHGVDGGGAVVIRRRITRYRRGAAPIQNNSGLPKDFAGRDRPDSPIVGVRPSASARCHHAAWQRGARVAGKPWRVIECY